MLPVSRQSILEKHYMQTLNVLETLSNVFDNVLNTLPNKCYYTLFIRPLKNVMKMLCVCWIGKGAILLDPCEHLTHRLSFPQFKMEWWQSGEHYGSLTHETRIILRSSSFMFPLLLITAEVKNTICNSFITMFYHKLAKFDQNRMIWTIQNFELFYKKPFQMLNMMTCR